MPRNRLFSFDSRDLNKNKKEFDYFIERVGKSDPRLVALACPAVPSENFFKPLLAALSRNNVLTAIDISNTFLLPSQISDLLTVLSNNTTLTQLNLLNSPVDIPCTELLLQFIHNHSNMETLQFTNPERSVDENSQEYISLKDSITTSLSANKGIKRFVKKVTNRFECKSRQLIAIQGFIKEKWCNRMTALDLTGNCLFHTPNLLSNFTLLTELLLASNDLSKIPDWIGELKNLQILDFTNNVIRIIPPGIYSLKNLRTFNISCNEINKIPLFIGNLPHLNIFSISGNPVMNVPSDIVDSSQYGDSQIIEYLRNELKSINDYQNNQIDNLEKQEDIKDLIDTLDDTELKAVDDFKNQEPENQHILLQDLDRIKQKSISLFSVLDVDEDIKFSSIAKIQDFIWCGTECGSICIWDTRNIVLQNKLKLHGNEITYIEQVPLYQESWSASTTGIVNIYNCKDKVAVLKKIEDFKETINCMVFSKSTKEMWIASENLVHRIPVETRDTSFVPFKVKSKIRCITYAVCHIWIGCESGIVYIYKEDGTPFLSYKAHNEPIEYLTATSDYVWTSSKSDTKIWKLEHINISVFMISCHTKYTRDICRGPFVLTKDEQYIFSISGDEDNETIIKWDTAGVPVKSFNSGHQNSIKFMAFSVSPDRLWTCTNNSLCVHELKRGKKTIERLNSLASIPKIKHGEDSSDSEKSGGGIRATVANKLLTEEIEKLMEDTVEEATEGTEIENTDEEEEEELKKQEEITNAISST